MYVGMRTTTDIFQRRRNILINIQTIMEKDSLCEIFS